jgi:hypothetical protein
VEGGRSGFRFQDLRRIRCDQLGGYAARAGHRKLHLVWGSAEPNPAVWFCRK